jgi:hypothetical protein
MCVYRNRQWNKYASKLIQITIRGAVVTLNDTHTNYRNSGLQYEPLMIQIEPLMIQILPPPQDIFVSFSVPLAALLRRLMILYNYCNIFVIF